MRSLKDTKLLSKGVNNMKEGYEKYNHHGTDVTVKSDLKGLHREHCICWQGCKKFNPDGPREKNCPIANEIFNNCVKFNVVTPVWECPKAEF